MENITKNPPEYSNLARCSLAIEILFLILMLLFIFKQLLNFFKQNYVPVLLTIQTAHKYQQNTKIIGSNEKTAVQKALQEIQPKQVSLEGKSKIPIKESQGAINSMKLATNTEQHNHQITDLDKDKKAPNLQSLKSRGRIFTFSLISQKVMLKTPLIGVVIINIALLTSEVFLTIVAYFCIFLLIISEFFKERWFKTGIVLDILVIGLNIAAFINAYTINRIKEKS